MANLLQKLQAKYFGGEEDKEEFSVIRDYIKGHEGTELKPYKDTSGNLTVGSGHLFKEGEPVVEKTQPESDALLDEDVRTHIEKTKDLFPDYDKFPISVKKALVDGRFRGDYTSEHKTTQLINRGDFLSASNEYINRQDYRESKASEGKPNAFTGVYKRLDENAKLLKDYGEESDLKAGIPQLKALTPEKIAQSRGMTPDEKDYFQMRRNIDLIKKYPTDYVGGNKRLEAVIKGIFPGTTETETPGIEEAYPGATFAGNMGRIIGLAWLIGPTAAIPAQALEKTTALHILSKFYPSATRVISGMITSSLTGAGVFGISEAEKQALGTEKAEPVKIVKEAGWGALRWAPWGIVRGTKVGLFDTKPIVASLKRAGLAGGLVGTGTAIENLLRKHKIGATELQDILLNSLSAMVLHGIKGKIKAGKLHQKDIDVFAKDSIRVRLQRTRPNMPENEREALTSLLANNKLMGKFTSSISSSVQKGKDIVTQMGLTSEKGFVRTGSTKQIASIAKQFGVSPKLITEAVKTGVFTGLPAQAVKAIQALQPTPEAIETKEPIIAEAKKYPDAKSFVGGQVETHKDIKYLDPELYDNRTDFVRDIEKLNPIPGGFNRDIAMKQINTAFELWGDKDPSKSVREILVDKVDLVEYPLGYEMDSPKEVTKPIEVIYSEGRYRLVDGRHRLAQAKFNKQKTIKATVEGETPIVNLTDTWNKAHAKPQIKPISPLKPSITAPKPPEVVKEVVAPGGSLKTAKMDILDRPLDVSEQTKYTINERTIAHGSEKQFQKNISQASEDIRNIHTPGTLRKFPLSKIAEGIERRGFVDFRGREVQDIHEIAEIASAFRHPKIEQLQTIFIKNNEIIAHQVVSSGLPDTGYFGEKLAYNIKRVADKLGADEVYLAHNHPSGDPSVSQSDAQMTASLSKKLSGKLKGHIVIDDTDYGLITIDIGGKSASAEYFSFKEPKESYRKGVYKIGKELNATSVAKIVRGFVKDNKASIVFLDIKSHILSIDNIDLEKNLYQYIEDAKKNYGSPRYVIAHKKGFDLKLKTAPDGLLDVIEIEGNKFISGSIRQPIEKPRDTGIYRIQETPEIAISEEEQKLFPKFGTEGEGFVLYKTPSEIKAMKESPALKEQQRMAKLQEAEIQRKLKLQKEKEKLGEYLAKPTPGKIKPAIHEKTGYTKLVDKISTTEYQVLKEQLRAEAKGAKIGYRVGKKEVRSLESIKKDTEATVKSLTHLGKLDLPIEYKDIIDSELESLGLLEGERPLRAKKKLAEFIEEQKAKGELIPLSESEVALADYTDLNTATLDLLKRKKDILKQIAHIGKEAKYVTLQNERIELDRVIQQTSNQIYTTTGKEPQGFEGQVKFPSQRRKGTLQSTMNKIDAYFAHQRKVEFMCRTFDGNKFGKCQKYISEPIQQAYNKEVLTNEKDLTSFRNHIKANFSDKEFDELFSKEFPIAGRKMTKQEMMGVYLNSLNEGNLERLVRGFGMSPEEISIISGKLSVKEKALANLMQRTVDGKWNAISGVKEKLTGKRMGKVEGYWPIYTDKELSAQAMLQEAQKDLFQDVLNKTFIERGFSKERVGGSAPVDLNAFSVFSNHISRVNHFISHAIPVKNVQKVITTPQIKQAITDGLSENYYKQFPVWLRSVANPKTYSMDSSEKVPAWLRKKATSAMLGLKTSVSLVQSGSFTLTVHEIGFKDATAGLLEFYKHPIENIEFIYSQSPQMKFRAKTFDRDVKDWLESRDAKSIIKGDAKKGAVLYSMIKTVDKFTTLPSWLGAYNKNMKLSNGNIEESVRFADGVARRTQPSGSAKDLSAMSKGSEWKKLFTMFYTHFSNYQNQMVSIMDTLKFSPEHPLRKAGNALTAYWWVAVAPALMAKFIRSGGKERNWQEYAKAVIKYGFSGLIGIRDVVGNIIDKRYDPMTSPALALPTAVAKLGISLMAEEKKPKTIMKAVSDTVGYSTGLPTPQGWITTTGLIDLMQGTTHDLRRLLLSKYALGGKSKTETIKDKYFGATKSSIGKIQKKYFGTDSKIDDLKKKYF